MFVARTQTNRRADRQTSIHARTHVRIYTNYSRINRIGISTENHKGEIERAVGEICVARLSNETIYEVQLKYGLATPYGIDTFLRRLHAPSMILLRSIFPSDERRIACVACFDAQHFMHSI